MKKLMELIREKKIEQKIIDFEMLYTERQCLCHNKPLTEKMLSLHHKAKY